MHWARVDTSLIHQVWPDVKDYINSAFTTGVNFPEWSTLYSMDSIRMQLLTGEWQLLVYCDEISVIHGALVVVYINYPLHRVAFVIAVGGKGLRTKQAYNELKEIFKHNGATMIQAYGRKSVQRALRIYNFQPRLTLMESLL